MKRLVSAWALLLFSQVSLGAVCKVAEFASLPRDPANLGMQIPVFPPNRVQSVTHTTSTAVGNVFLTNTRYIGFICDTLSYFEVNTVGAATATSADPWVGANTWMYIGVPAGYEIAFSTS